MIKKNQEQSKTTLVKRFPVVAIMGHIDHGKSTLLDYIRRTNTTEKEVGGITQHLGAYEVSRTTKDGAENNITFIDTPGHEAFSGIRARGASVADIAILVVSGEEGVKPQTREAYLCIKKAKIPYLVAINKIDSEKADVEHTKQSLAENEIYLEGYGGDVPWVLISGKSGEGIPELLDTVILLGDLSELTGDPLKNAEGTVVEAHLDKREGITAVLIMKNGTLKKGQVLVSGQAYAVVRSLKSSSGAKIEEATFSSPVKVFGWNTLPTIGETFNAFDTKKEAQEHIASRTKTPLKMNVKALETTDKIIVNLIIKADASGSLEAMLHEIKKLAYEKIHIKIIHTGIGEISLNDVKKSEGLSHTFIIGFNTKVDLQAKNHAERLGISIHTFNIIYKLMEWLKSEIEAKIPKENMEEAQGKAKILKVFSRSKDKQIVGGRVELGSIFLGEEVKVLRREALIGKGRIKELQQQKSKATEAKKDTEFGAQIQCPIEIVPGDKIEGFKIIQK